MSIKCGIKENETVSWKTEKVKTRSQSQCRTYWTRHLSQIKTKYAFEKWFLNLRKDDPEHITASFNENEIYKLITLIFEANIDDKYLIDWNDLMNHFDNVPSRLKLKFQDVCKEVPLSHRVFRIDRTINGNL